MRNSIIGEFNLTIELTKYSIAALKKIRKMTEEKFENDNWVTMEYEKSGDFYKIEICYKFVSPLRYFEFASIVAELMD